MNEVASITRPLSVAILAIGGEGGGVLADWIIGLAEQNGYLGQGTSVPGVAQRTGATIYYIEMFPAGGREPVFALMPVPGDVDIVIASELMEAARAVQRGLVTPDRTTLIASTHRVYSIAERSAVADGRVDSAALISACRAAAREYVAFDMSAIAETTNSAVSAVLFGALAGSGKFPFSRAAFEATIRKAGIGGTASLAAFAAGFEAARNPAAPADQFPQASAGSETDDLARELIVQTTPDTAAIIRAGVARLVDYQDEAYANLYLDRLRPVLALQLQANDAEHRLLAEAARQLALAMSYEDTIRVADLKIRKERFDRVRSEVKPADGQIVEIAEFLHPRTEEIADTLPASLGRWILRTGWVRRSFDRLTRRGKTIRTSSIGGFLILYAIASMRRLRRRSLRYNREEESLEVWLAMIPRAAAHDYKLAVETARVRGLIKGYGDTHARGQEKFNLIASLLPELMSRSDGASSLARLHKAAVAEESTGPLIDCIATLRSSSADQFPGQPPATLNSGLSTSD